MKQKVFNNLIKDFYEKNKIKKINYLDKFFYLYAIKNKLLFFYCKNFIDDESYLTKQILFKGSKMLDEKKASKKIILEISKNRNLKFKDLKTDRIFPDINTDFDVLVKKKDFETWKNELIKAGFKMKKHHTFFKSTSEYQKNFLKKNFAKIDLTVHFNYKGFDYLSEDYLWNKDVSDEEKKVIIMSLAIIFKRLYINLNDFFLILNFIKKKNFSEHSIDQMKKYGWYDVMMCFTDEIDKAYTDFDNIKFPYFSWKLFFKILKFDFKNISKFPYWFWFYFVLVQIRSYLFYKGDYLPFHVFWVSYKKIK